MINLATKDDEILHLKIRNQQISTKGLGAAETLRTEKVELKAQDSTLIEEVQGLNVEVKDLTKQLFTSHAIESARIEKLLKFFSHKPLFY